MPSVRHSAAKVAFGMLPRMATLRVSVDPCLAGKVRQALASLVRLDVTETRERRLLLFRQAVFVVHGAPEWLAKARAEVDAIEADMQDLARW